MTRNKSNIPLFPFSAQTLPEMFDVKMSIFCGIKPKEFLQAAKYIDDTEVDWKRVEYYNKLIIKGSYINSLYLIVDDNQVIGHEGRHRAIAAGQLGVKYLPCALFVRGRERYFTYEGYKEMREIDNGIGKGTHAWLKLVGNYQCTKMNMPPGANKKDNEMLMLLIPERDIIKESRGINTARESFIAKLKICGLENLFNVLD